MIGVVVAGGGKGERFGEDKILFPISGKPILLYTLIPFIKIDKISSIVVVVRKEIFGKVKELIKPLKKFNKTIEVVEGGERRRDSVLNGLIRMKRFPVDKVLIHDGARPLVSLETIKRVISGIGERSGCIPCLPVRETIKFVERGFVLNTPERSKLFSVQTPQGFPFPLILEKIKKFNEPLYDDAMAFEKDGLLVKVVEGNIENIKITYREDIYFVERMIDEHKDWYRV